MFTTLSKSVWLFCSIVAALHADDQTSLTNPIENPLTPSVEFLHNLQTPTTLLLVENSSAAQEAASRLQTLLQEFGHDITSVSLQDLEKVQLKSDSQWNFDTILVVSNTMPRTASSKTSLVQTLLSFVDIQWTLPTDEVHKPFGLRLPPSLLIFTDGACADLHNETTVCGSQDCTATVNSEMLQLMRGIGLDSTNRHHCQASKSSSLLSEASSTYNEKQEIPYTGSSHLHASSNNLIVPVLQPAVEMPASRIRTGLGATLNLLEHAYTALKEETLTESLVSAFQGERSWSRVIFSSSMSLCNNDVNRSFCTSLLDWATHRRDVITWSNLRHWRLHEKFEWSEYEGDTIRTTWTTDELANLEMTRPFLYRIRDEIIVGVDMWQISSEDGVHFRWMPLREPWVKFEYNMMETYIRKLLIPASLGVHQPTNLMRAAQQSNFTSVGSMSFNPATHWIHYKAPKQHGIFKLVLKSVRQYHRTPIWVESLMPLRTYKHDEDPRFVPSAYPYYSSVILSTLLFAIMSFIFPLLPAGRQHLKVQ